MKINIQKVKSSYSTEISQALANEYEAIMIPIECEYEPHCLGNCDDEDYMFDIANDYGWDRFILVDFTNNKDKLIDLYELEAA